MKESRQRKIDLIMLSVLGLLLLFILKRDILIPKDQVQARPLVAMIEFEDYKYTELDLRENWSLKGYKGEEYTPEFVENILFGDSTYKGSDGKDYMTLNKYYKDISGNKFSVKGKVYGWYQAKGRAKDYGANVDNYYGDQKNAKKLVEEAIEALAKDPSVNLEEFDQFNKIDKEKPYNSPDGIIDTLIIVHPGIGEEHGGGSLGQDAIWPFRMGFSWFNEGDEPYYKVKDHKGKEWFFDDFILVSQDFALDNIIHEYGHILNLPDLYGFDNSKSPIGYWSIMSNSYTGKNIIGSMPLDMGAYCRLKLQEEFDRKNIDANFVNMKEIDYRDLDRIGREVYISESNTRNDKIDLVKINLPGKSRQIARPVDGDKVFYSGKEKNSRNHMTTKIKLDNYNNISLNIKALYDLKSGYDFFTVRVKDRTGEKTIKGNKTTSEVSKLIKDDKLKKQRNPGQGLTGKSQGWEDLVYDLSDYAGEEIELSLYFWSDNAEGSYIYIDNISILGDNNVLLKTNGEENYELKNGRLEKTSLSPFSLKGFIINNGEQKFENYYLLEWRNPRPGCIDEGLSYIRNFGSQFAYNSGLVVWYIDTYWQDEWGRPDQQSALHIGEVFAGVVDADQSPINSREKDKVDSMCNNVDVLLYDSAFSLRKGETLRILDKDKKLIEDKNTFMNPFFDETKDYSNKIAPMAGLKLTNNGLMAYITQESADGSGGMVYIGNTKYNNKFYSQNHFKIGNIYYEGLELAIDLVEASGDKFYISVVNDKGRQVTEQLSLVNDKLYASEEITNLLRRENYNINFLISESEDESLAIYNSNIHHKFGIELNIKN